MAEHGTADAGEAQTLEKRRAFMALPLDQRRRQMAEQADKALKDYQAEDETVDRQLWQGGDIVDTK